MAVGSARRGEARQRCSRVYGLETVGACRSSLADRVAGVRASDTVDQNIAKDRAASAAQNFQSAGTCSPADCTNGRPARPDNRSAGTGAAPRNEPCCTSWWPGTRRRYLPSCATPTRRRRIASLRRTRARCVSAVRHPRTRLHARTLPDLPRRDRGCVQLQAARNLSELHRATHGRHRRASGRSRAAARTLPTVGVYGAQAAAPRAHARSGVDELDRRTRRPRARRVAETRRAQARNPLAADRGSLRGAR